jgi:hypothetical protein
MIVLALDQAPTITGWAYGGPNGAFKFGTKEFPDCGDNESTLMGEVFDWAVDLGKSIGVTAVFTEQLVIYPDRVHLPSLHKQFAIIHAVAFACGKHGLNVPHYEAPISAWRARFLGMASAPRSITKGGRKSFLKDAAQKACLDRGYLVDSHHAAEAVGILDYGLAELDEKYRWATNATVRRQREKATSEAALARGAMV